MLMMMIFSSIHIISIEKWVTAYQNGYVTILYQRKHCLGHLF